MINNKIIDEIQIHTYYGWKKSPYLSERYKGKVYSRSIGRDLCSFVRSQIRREGHGLYRFRYQWSCGSCSPSFAVGA